MTQQPTDSKRVHLRIRGRVQGVFYRESARREAAALGLRGWVRNLSDGDVEALAEGRASDVDRFIVWCRQGPQTARVTDVAVKEEKASGDLADFHVERNA
jgi:acylphosphatase